jgi:hypothetical protein|tara:strand:- start:524 stop:667 length:144 start_codon:yes stop_codon:yes gene_type:complete
MSLVYGKKSDGFGYRGAFQLEIMSSRRLARLGYSNTKTLRFENGKFF